LDRRQRAVDRERHSAAEAASGHHDDPSIIDASDGCNDPGRACRNQASAPSCSTKRSASSIVLAFCHAISRWTPASSYVFTTSAVTGGGGVTEISTSPRSAGRSPAAMAARIQPMLRLVGSTSVRKPYQP